jgi:hypothetical protein
VTGSAESGADPGAIVAVLADPPRLPDWAPAFADAVTGDSQSGWRVTKDGQDFTVRVVANRDARTVDYLREVAPGRVGAPTCGRYPGPAAGAW